MLQFRLRYANVILLSLVGVALCLNAAEAQSVPEKPSGFTGYLLDTKGLDQDGKEAAWSETFESPGVSWRYLYQDGSVKILSHQRVGEESHQGERSELINYEVEEPGVVVFGHYVDYPGIFEETSPSVWVRSDRPGVTLAALVVFPKTLRPDTGTPVTALLVGMSYDRPGEWQKLKFANGLTQTLENTVQAIRGEHKLPLDKNCAYIRQIALISEARYGRYSLWVDDLEISEHIRPENKLLRNSERVSRFDPINLLSSRLQASQSPIFWQNAEENDMYGTEPFAIDEEKVKANEKKLKFSTDALASNTFSQNLVPTTNNKLEFEPETIFPKNQVQGFGSATDRNVQPSFEESLFQLSANDEFTSDNTSIAQRSRQFGETSIPTRVENKGKVGQTGFVDAEYSNNNQVAQTGFDTPEDFFGLSSTPDYQALHPVDYLVSGSGTLDSSEDAAEIGFFRQGEKLVPNVQVTSGGNIETNERRVYSIRAIEYNNEPFAFLKKLGFNAVWLHAPPTQEELQQANEVGMWLIAQPPTGEQLVPNSTEGGSDPKAFFGGGRPNAVYDPVIAWDLGRRLRLINHAEIQRNIQIIKELDPHRRPILASIYNGTPAYTSGAKVDVVLLDREPLLTSLDLNDYGDWLLNYKNLASFGVTAFWNLIQTQPQYSATLQRQYFGKVEETPGLVSYEQMRQCVRLSMRAGMRGLIFTSNSRLDAKDRQTQYRACALEALNLELQFLLTWFAMGNAETSLLDTSSDELSAFTMKMKRAALVAPISTASDNQFVMGQDAVYDWGTTISVPESYSPDLLTPGALRKILTKRRAGGSSFSLEEGSMNSLIFFTQSDALCHKMTEQALAYGRRMAELTINLARKRLDLYEQTVYGIQYVKEHGASSQKTPEVPLLGPILNKAYAQLDEAEQSLRRRDASQAFLMAERATREMRKAERDFWEQATKTEIARPVTPLSTSFYDMPVYLELYEKLVSGKLRASGPNLILGGDMENPNAARQNGWQIYTEQSVNLNGQVVYDSVAKRTGERGLHIVVSPQVAGQPPAEAECPAIIAEVGFNTRIGQLICIQGWIKIPRDLTNSVDGVEIYDDQGGKALALRFKQASEWKRFAFYRISTNDGPMRLRFAFSGVGEVYLDDVAAYVVQ